MKMRKTSPVRLSILLWIMLSSTTTTTTTHGFTTTLLHKKHPFSSLHNHHQLYSSPPTEHHHHHHHHDDHQKVKDIATQELKRTAAHLQKLRENFNDQHSPSEQTMNDAETETLYKQLLQRPASSLKEECQELKLVMKGRKPDLARRLAQYYIEQQQKGENEEDDDEDDELDNIEIPNLENNNNNIPSSASFASLTNLSPTATSALHRASFLTKPTPIQSVAIPHLHSGKSAILHAPTGSGKTLTYLLPITEYLWSNPDEEEQSMAIVLTPTRELAAQVAGVAKVLSPPNSVRFISRPTNLLKSNAREKGEAEGYGGILADKDEKRKGEVRILVGSAKCIYASLFGSSGSSKKKKQAAPMSKMEGKYLLGKVKWLVMDEVDRLLHVKKSRMDKQHKRKHEKPAAVLTSAITRLTLGSTQIIAASATVGRPLRRELARVLGLPSQECPPILRGGDMEEDNDNDNDDDDDFYEEEKGSKKGETGRAVTIPQTVRHYVLPTDGSTSGAILTSAALIVRSMTTKNSSRKILFVLSKNCGMTIHNTLGVLRHFGCSDPEPKSLLDVLEADGTDRLIEVHRRVSGSTGVGESSLQSLPQKHDQQDDDNNGEGYVLVCNEDSVRGLHLDGLDYVIVVGRPRGPDEYTHIAGRTGRAGKTGAVVNVVSFEQAAALTSWEKMLDVDFIPLDEEEVMEDDF